MEAHKIIQVVLSLFTLFFGLEDLLGEQRITTFEQSWLNLTNNFRRNIINNIIVIKNIIFRMSYSIPKMLFLFGSFLLFAFIAIKWNPYVNIRSFWIDKVLSVFLMLFLFIYIVFIGIFEGIGPENGKSYINLIFNDILSEYGITKGQKLKSMPNIALEIKISNFLVSIWQTSKTFVINLDDILLSPLTGFVEKKLKKPIPSMSELYRWSFILIPYSFILNMVVFLYVIIGVNIFSLLILLDLILITIGRFIFSTFLFIVWLLFLAPSQLLKKISNMMGQRSILKIGRYIIVAVGFIINQIFSN